MSKVITRVIVVGSMCNVNMCVCVCVPPLLTAGEAVVCGDKLIKMAIVDNN